MPDFPHEHTDGPSGRIFIEQLASLFFWRRTCVRINRENRSRAIEEAALTADSSWTRCSPDGSRVPHPVFFACPLYLALIITLLGHVSESRVCLHRSGRLSPPQQKVNSSPASSPYLTPLKRAALGGFGSLPQVVTHSGASI